MGMATDRIQLARSAQYIERIMANICLLYGPVILIMSDPPLTACTVHCSEIVTSFATVVGNMIFLIRNGACKLSFQVKLVWFRIYILVMLPTTGKRGKSPILPLSRCLEHNFDHVKRNTQSDLT
ncbi:MAG: hypothetical protein J07HQX50_00774 [Haloquadratum sp. J07HQX50]|nr:MAG: hypothetical protein J07HQX50_00774 [Haloquadratum sp. J07HQX50]